MCRIRLASSDHPIDLKRAADVETALRGTRGAPDIIAVLVESSRDPALYLEHMADALLRQEADVAICPAGFLAGGVPPGLEVGALLGAGDRRYFCTAAVEPEFDHLATGSKIVAWDEVSMAQIAFRRPDLRTGLVKSWSSLFEELRHGAWDAACLPHAVSSAGSSWGLRTAPIDPELVMPAIGQGDVALLTTLGLDFAPVSEVNDPAVQTRLRVETAFWRRASEVTGAVCTARAELMGDEIRLSGLLADASGAWLVEDSGQAALRFGEFGAEDVAESVKAMALLELNRRGTGRKVAS